MAFLEIPKTSSDTQICQISVERSVPTIQNDTGLPKNLYDLLHLTTYRTQKVNTDGSKQEIVSCAYDRAIESGRNQTILVVEGEMQESISEPYVTISVDGILFPPKAQISFRTVDVSVGHILDIKRKPDGSLNRDFSVISMDLISFGDSNKSFVAKQLAYILANRDCVIQDNARDLRLKNNVRSSMEYLVGALISC